MDDLYGGLHRTGQTIETGHTLKLPKGSLGNSNPNPNAFENFGSSLRVAPSSSQSQPKSKPKPKRSVSRDPTRAITIKKPVAQFLDSDDELDLLSTPKADPDDYKPSNKASASQPFKFPVLKSQVYSKLKFTKTKSITSKDNAAIPSSSSSKNQPDSKENSQDFGSWVADLNMKGKAATGEDDDIPEISSPLHQKSSNQRLSPPQSSSKQPIHHKPPDTSLPARPRPRPLPLPRPTCKPSAKPDTIFVDGHELIPLGRSKTTVTKGKKNPSRSPSLSISTPKKRPLPKTRSDVIPLNFEVQSNFSAFPMPSPQSSKGAGTSQPKGKSKAKPFPLDEADEDEADEDVADEESDRDVRKKTSKRKGKQKQTSSSPKTFPMDKISPLGGKKQKKLPLKKVKSPSSKALRKLKAFPMPSPQASDKSSVRATLQSKGKNKAWPSPDESLSILSEGSSDDERQAKKKRQSSLSYVFLFIFNIVFVGLILLDQT